MTHRSSGSGDQRPRALLLSMYRLDRGLWGPTARITQMRDALRRIVRLDVVAGDRGRRAMALARYGTRGRLRGLGGIYVESSTALPGPADLAFLAFARMIGIPVVTYIRDAYQLFEEYRSVSIKGRASRLLFGPAMRSLTGVSDVTAFPSRGLAEAVHGGDGARNVALVPPGARVTDAPPVDPGARSLLFVGALKHTASGGKTLVEAMEVARRSAPDLRLIAVSRPGEEIGGSRPPWLQVRRAQGAEIDRILPEVLATVIPRPRSPYNDLAIPIKLMDYLGYGRPTVVTDATETAAIVRAAGCGVVTGDSALALGSGIARVATAEPAQISAWGAAALEAAVANSWDSRARTIVDLLGLSA